MMQQILTFLEEYSGALTILITAVYVIATICIFHANRRAANASQKQVAEMQRQFKESNRPYITCEYILKKRAFCGIRICNHGNMVAKNLTFSISKDFIDALQPEHQVNFQKQNESQYKLIGIGQEYYFFFSDVQHKPKVPFEMTIHYQSETGSFSETFCFDLSKQLPVYSTEETEEMVLNTLSNISKSLQSIAEYCNKKHNNI